MPVGVQAAARVPLLPRSAGRGRGGEEMPCSSRAAVNTQIWRCQCRGTWSPEQGLQQTHQRVSPEAEPGATGECGGKGPRDPGSLCPHLLLSPAPVLSPCLSVSLALSLSLTLFLPLILILDCVPSGPALSSQHPQESRKERYITLCHGVSHHVVLRLPRLSPLAV